MHAYLFVGNQEIAKAKATKFAESISAAVYPMELKNIKDTRTISSFVKLAQHKKIIILIENIQSASNDALQAFLKDLEEPGENIFYALHATNEDRVLPTIRSRCEIVRLDTSVEPKNDVIFGEYLSTDLTGKLAITDKIKGRDEAIEFVDGLLFFMHQKLVTNPSTVISKKIETVVNTKNNLESNGNVFLHLSLMSIEIDNDL